MDWLEHTLQTDLPEGWQTSVQRTDGTVTVQCEHVVLGGHEFHWTDEAGADPGEAAAGEAARIVARLDELGLLAATRGMPELTGFEAETLRATHAMIGAARLSQAQSRSVMGLSQALGQLSTDALAWALETVDLLAPWYGYPPDPSAAAGG